MKVKSESEVAQLCPTLRFPLDCSLPGSSVHGIFQARILEWVAIVSTKPYIPYNIHKIKLHIYKLGIARGYLNCQHHLGPLLNK